MNSFPHHYSVDTSVQPQSEALLSAAGVTTIASRPPRQFGGQRIRRSGRMSSRFWRALRPTRGYELLQNLFRRPQSARWFDKVDRCEQPWNS